MKIGEWLRSKLTVEKRVRGAKGSLRYNGFYINIFIKDMSLNFNSFKEYYDRYLKGKIVEVPGFMEIDFNTSDGSIISKFVSLVKLGGIKSKEVWVGLGNKPCSGIQITLWFPEVKYA